MTLSKNIVADLLPIPSVIEHQIDQQMRHGIGKGVQAQRAAHHPQRRSTTEALQWRHGEAGDEQLQGGSTTSGDIARHRIQGPAVAPEGAGVPQQGDEADEMGAYADIQTIHDIFR